MSSGEKNINLVSTDTIVDNSFYTATLDPKSGDWVYKAKTLSLNQDGKYKDVPRYPIIYQYEGKFKRMYAQTLDKMVTDIGLKLIDFNKKQQL